MSGVWLWPPLVGPIRVSTVAAGVVVFAIVMLKRRDPIRALVTVLAWASAFEILYSAIAIFGFHAPMYQFVWETAALNGWVVAAAAMGIWPDWRIAAIFVMVMGLWAAAGYHANLPGRPLVLQDEVLNEVAKTMLAVAYLVGALRVRGAESAPAVMSRSSA